MERADFAREMNFYKCVSCGFLFSDALDGLSSEEWQKFYAYPNYLKYDPGAVTQRRKERTKALVKHVAQRFNISEPKILLHGNGSCESAKELLAEGFDVWTTFDHLEDWGRSLTMDGAEAMCDFDIVCSIEVAEHFCNPLKEFMDALYVLRKGGVFCGTTSMNDGIPHENMQRDEWHYTKPHTLNAGHISIYSLKSLDKIAEELSCKNLTERGSSKMREVSHMPSTSVFFQFQK